MGQTGKQTLFEILTKFEAELAAEWAKAQTTSGGRRIGPKEPELREQCAEFLRLLNQSSITGRPDDIQGEEWRAVREMLAEVTRARSLQGSSPTEIATFVFSLKQPLFTRLRREFAGDNDGLAESIWLATELLDRLGLYTTEIHQATRENVIARQQQEMLELSTPVVKLWDGILALPMIGTLDSARTQIVMESLLQKIVETNSPVAIIDITGVPTVDTLTAQHLLKTVTAARLMGADCIISGIRPQIAQTIVHLGVDLGAVITKSSMADAFALALKRGGLSITKTTSRE